MRIYDVSVGIQAGMPVWPGDPDVVLERVSRMEDGAENNLSRLACSVHVGTHVDAPLHFVADGASIDEISFRTLVGRAYVVDLPDVDRIDADVLEAAGIPTRTRRVLFRTRNSAMWTDSQHAFQKDYVALDVSGAEWLVRRGVQLVGVDYLSVAPFKDGSEVHRILLEREIVVVEGLDLREVTKGRYTLYCLPLRLIGSDGAPARVILIGV
ncbi:MAG: cyclase family protein [Anaerolineales bacterium]|nr:cyclase family protein [Anaerolineales bacterium]